MPWIPFKSLGICIFSLIRNDIFAQWQGSEPSSFNLLLLVFVDFFSLNWSKMVFCFS